jgi:aminoglycoside phosphotransferase family enzyme
MLGIKHMDEKTMRQYQEEERSLINNRVKLVHYRLQDLLTSMKQDIVSPQKKVDQLALELSEFHHQPSFKKCKNMGELVEEQLNHYLTVKM